MCGSGIVATVYSLISTASSPHRRSTLRKSTQPGRRQMHLLANYISASLLTSQSLFSRPSMPEPRATLETFHDSDTLGMRGSSCLLLAYVFPLAAMPLSSGPHVVSVPPCGDITVTDHGVREFC